MEELAGRTSVRKNELSALAEAGALEAIEPGRKAAIWKSHAPRFEGPARRVGEQASLFVGFDSEPRAPALPSLHRTEALVLDYERTGVSIGDHPMKIARSRLSRTYKSAKAISSMRHGTKAVAAGLVICRQRPATASGVVFLTLEDETGFINVVLWSRVFETFRHVTTTSSLLTIRGHIEREGDVVHLIARTVEPLILPELSDEQVPSMSRDFH